MFWVKLPTERSVSSRQHVGRAEWFFAPLDLHSGVVAEWKPAGKTHWCCSRVKSNAMPQNTQYVFKFSVLSLVKLHVSTIEKWPLKDHEFFNTRGMYPFTFYLQLLCFFVSSTQWRIAFWVFMHTIQKSWNYCYYVYLQITAAKCTDNWLLLNFVLDLFANPLAQDYDYRSYIIHHVPSVDLLDRKGKQHTVYHVSLFISVLFAYL